eukprot:TRINITY_DN40125_c0_g1_i1.p1 TRINITY_DN40125_c0_g1~~TRINITY_DN40125_c0_g1_i1.p1  ORF type:complete len:539 (-),score=83.35 TRINITY_DN40125_c0_g1_i1:116-1507(-)
MTGPTSCWAPPCLKKSQDAREHSRMLGKKGKASAMTASEADLRAAHAQAPGSTSALGRAGATLLRSDRSSPGLPSVTRPLAASGCTSAASTAPASSRGGSFFSRSLGRSPPKATAPTSPSDGVKSGGFRGFVSSLQRGGGLSASLDEAAMRAATGHNRLGSFDAASNSASASSATSATAIPRATSTSGPGPKPDSEGGTEDAPFASSMRRYSESSRQALSTLWHLERDLERMESRVRGFLGEAEVLSRLPSSLEEGAASSTRTIGQVRASLAQVEAEAHKLESRGVDNIYTGELDSGKTEAKQLKKSLLARLERLFESVEGIFQRLKTAESANQGTNVSLEAAVDAATIASATPSEPIDMAAPTSASAASPSTPPADPHDSSNRSSTASGDVHGAEFVACSGTGGENCTSGSNETHADGCDGHGRSAVAVAGESSPPVTVEAPTDAAPNTLNAVNGSGCEEAT